MYIRADTQVGPYTTVLTRRGAPVCAPACENHAGIYTGWIRFGFSDNVYPQTKFYG
jgi:hypothetical protein